MGSNRSHMIDWMEKGAVAPGEAQRALRVAGVFPDGKRWRQFIDRLLLALGGLALAISLVFFIAYNWNELGRAFRFGLVGMALLASVLAYWKLGAKELAGQVALTVSCLVLGVLLAYFGQTYQTGADTWQLFATWALLMLPWAVIGRFAPIWLLWLALLNLSLVLYHQVWPGIFGLLFGNEQMAWLLFAFNGLAWAAWEGCARHVQWMTPRTWVRLIALACGTAITLVVLYGILDNGAFALLEWLAWLAWAAVVVLIYRKRNPDLFMLAGVCLSAIVASTLQASHWLIDLNDYGLGFLLINILLVGEAAVAAMWLRKVHREQGS
jgi:uncharacterized membrane protein